jgi:hypothetical protein
MMSDKIIMSPFFINLRMDNINHLLQFATDNYADDYDLIKNDVIAVLRTCRDDLGSAHIITKAWNDSSIDINMCQNIIIYLSAAILKMRSNDIQGLKWCMCKIATEVRVRPHVIW